MIDFAVGQNSLGSRLGRNQHAENLLGSALGLAPVRKVKDARLDRGVQAIQSQQGHNSMEWSEARMIPQSCFMLGEDSFLLQKQFPGRTDSWGLSSGTPSSYQNKPFGSEGGFEQHNVASTIEFILSSPCPPWYLSHFQKPQSSEYRMKITDLNHKLID